MCGIVAVYTWGDNRVEMSTLIRATEAQAHRGPDGAGYAGWIDSAPLAQPDAVCRGRNSEQLRIPQLALRVGLGNNWLAIQDSSPAAAQPLATDDGLNWLVFNGEIYNHVELRARLEAEGERFRTHSDSEVLLKAWKRQGPMALNSFRGMFAFALYEAASGTLWIVRDRFGIKPLYFSLSPGLFIAASEIRALHASGLVSPRLDGQSVLAFLAACITKPSEEGTIYAEVFELQPGMMLQIDVSGVRRRRYYSLPELRAELDEHCVPELRRMLLETVDMHLRSSTDVALSLSGGLDSTTIAHASSRVKNNHSKGLTAFSFGSAGSAELTLAATAASEAGLEWVCVPAPDTFTLDDLIEITAAVEIPMPAWGCLNSLVLLRAVKQHDFRVLISGQGGDEVLSGYPWFMSPLVREIEARDEALARRVDQFYRRRMALPSELQRTTEKIHSSARAWARTVSTGALRVLGMSEDSVLELPAASYYLNETLNLDEFRSRHIFRRDLPHLLCQEDRIGMWCSIETRVPFLDHEFAEFCGRLRPEFLVANGYLKSPLRLLFPETAPAIRWNVRKGGFWENNSALPPEFGLSALMASAASADIHVRDFDGLSKLEPLALWRFFQVALLRAGSPAARKDFVNDLTRTYSRALQSAAAGILCGTHQA